ncbi:antibiotic biosynthesis monooxygenase family protein [Palleronia sp. KMU-117]|uniref:antibiotic biosynthesis monooxygenase family protein n=1 Tax=Palleronia sp. KMU-117 TaxID=3434108 RepID=UPI003D7660EE
MHGLFFEVRPKPGHMAHYFDHVARLKPVLARHEGLVFLDRYRPLDDPGALLSHQIWASEEAIAAWRADATHRASQAAGRRVHFLDYRIRVGAQLTDLELEDGDGQTGNGRFLVAAYGAAPADLPGARAFESVNHAGWFVTLAPAGDGAAARRIARGAMDAGAETARIFAISRDYTMTDRAEAPDRDSGH